MVNSLVGEFLSERPEWRVHSRTVPVPGLDGPQTVVTTGPGKFALFRWAAARGVNPTDARAAAGLTERPDDKGK